MIEFEDFIGTWKLVSVETRKADGSVHRRGNRTGYLIYNSDGFMSVAFMKEGRKSSPLVILEAAQSKKK
jgi:hypothetical protein